MDSYLLTTDLMGDAVIAVKGLVVLPAFPCVGVEGPAGSEDDRL